MNKKIFSVIVITFAILSFSAQASGASISFQKDLNGLFTVTIKNSGGIKSFALTAPNKLPYGGDVSGCPTSRIITNAVFDEVTDFIPSMDASVTDCQDNKQTFKIPAPKNGFTSAVSALEPTTSPEPAQSSAQTAKSSASPLTDSSSLNDIKYPIPELGNCSSKDSCKSYCDKPQNSNACFVFAGQRNLMSAEELDHAKKFKDGGMIGPGSCKGQAECDQYCGNGDHMEECIAFAQKNGMMSSQQLEESQKVLAAVKKGVKPPACGGPKQCDAYCGSPEHMEECVNFSLAAGLMPDSQKEQMQKTLAAIKRGVKPPACRGPRECDTYCSNPEHMEECVNFAVETGMMPDDQKAQMQKTLDALKQGIKPPACQPNRPQNQQGQPGQPNQSGQQGGPNEGRGFNPGSGANGNGPGRSQGGSSGQSSQSDNGLPSCDQYCGEDSHVEECVKFSVAIGNMTEQQGQSAIKTRGKGPGGCVGRDACDTFCSNPDNQDTCFNFAKENGMIPQEDLQRMQDGQQRMKDSFSSIPPEVLDCLTSTVGADVVEKMKTGSVSNRSDGDVINQCFQKFNIREGTPSGNGPGSGQGGQPDQNQQGQFNRGQQGQNQFQRGPDCSPKGTAAVFVCAKNGRNASGGPETTYFNACTAKQDGAEVIHEGVCDGQKPCADVANPVCGNDGHTWVSACYADEQGGGVKSEGACENQSGGGPGQPGQNQNGQNQFGQPGEPGQQGQQKQGFGQFIQGFFGGQSGQSNQQGQQGQNQPGPGGINPGNQQMPQQAGPGGCKGPEECQKFCTSNPEVCKNFQPPQSQQGQSGQNQSRQQQNQTGQRGQIQPNQPKQQGGGLGPCGTGPGTCSGIGPDDVGFNKDNGGNGSGGPNRGQGFNPGFGQNGNGPGRGQGGGQQGQNQFNQGQFRQGGQQGQNQQMNRGQFNQPGQDNGGRATGPCGTGPGTCSGIGPDDVGSNGNNGGNSGGFNAGQGQFRQGGQPGQQGQPNESGQPGQNQFNQGQFGQPMNQGQFGGQSGQMQPGQFNQGQPGQFAPPTEMQPQQQPQPQF